MGTPQNHNGSILKLDHVVSYYGTIQVLFDMSLEVRCDQMVALMGRNGMGKTTTVRAIMGLTPPKSGSVFFEGRNVASLPAYRIAQAGVGLVPEGRQIFAPLTVKENLIATAANRTASPSPWTLERIFALFPDLARRRHHLGRQLSGGEQQMLAIGRALMTNPKLLILDEAAEGLAPLVRNQIWHCLKELKSAGLSTLIIDKNLDALMDICDYFYIMEKGCVAWHGKPKKLCADPSIRVSLLGV